MKNKGPIEVTWRPGALFMHVKRSGPPLLPLHLKSISPCIVCPKLFTGHHYSYSVVLLVPSVS